jgi:alkylation response protein AidB-like acyl-CoA dehydrogenase
VRSANAHPKDASHVTPYTPPTADQLLAIRVNAGIDELAQSERFAHAEPDLIEAIVEGVGQFAAGEFAPLNRIGDLEGAKLENGVVRLPDGFNAAYRAYVEQGWNAIASPVEHGGQGLPFTLSCNVLENLGAANMAFTLLPIITAARISRRCICPSW